MFDIFELVVSLLLKCELTVMQLLFCRGETASGRSRKARSRQIVRAEEPQAQDACATKQARPQTKKQEGNRVNTTVKLKLKLKPVNRIHFRYEALDSREQRVARLWDPTHHTLVTLGHS